MIALGAMPVRDSLLPSSIAPTAFITISDGSTFAASGVLGTPIVFSVGAFGGAAVAPCANTYPGAAIKTTAVTSATVVRKTDIVPLLVEQKYFLTLRRMIYRMLLDYVSRIRTGPRLTVVTDAIT